ncbi:MAG: hypothetical protein QME64_08405 [bacterium]|nr:hypothetical protein [bacterium]
MQQLALLFFITCFLLVGIYTGSGASLSHYNLFVILGEDNPGKLYQLKVLPNGEIINPHIQYPLVSRDPGDLEVTADFQYVLVASGYGINCFRVLNNGNLFCTSTTSVDLPEFFTITPNNELVIISTYYCTTVFSFTTTGELVNGTSAIPAEAARPDPLGRGLLANSTSYSLYSFSSYTINYLARTLHNTTSYTGGRAYKRYAFTPNGKLGFVYGMSVDPQDTGKNLWVLNIDSAFNVTTTSQIFELGDDCFKPTISRDNQFLWASTGSHIELLTINTTTGQVTDTGRKFYVLNTTWTAAGSQRKSPDDTLTVVWYDDTRLAKPGSFATAWINADGSLTWTGYYFNFELVYASMGTGIIDYELIPVYVTGLESDKWQLYE